MEAVIGWIVRGNLYLLCAALMTCPPRSCAARTGPTVWLWKRPSATTIQLLHYHRSVNALSAIMATNTMTMEKMRCRISSRHHSILRFKNQYKQFVYWIIGAYWSMGSILFFYITIKADFPIKQQFCKFN